MRRACLLLLLFLAAPIAARPAADAGDTPSVAVRVYGLFAPTEVTLTPVGDVLRLRLCPSCKPIPATAPVKVVLSGGHLKLLGVGGSGHLGAIANSLDTVEISGTYQLDVPGNPRVACASPLTIHASEGRLLLTLRLPLEDYVAGVLAGESSNFTSPEALKAMSVAVRTFAVRHRRRHKAGGFDYCDTTHCQVFRINGAWTRMRAAAEDTAGELLWYEGLPAATYYHRHCGGTTEAVERAWTGRKAPYLRQVSDTYCTARDRGEWSAEIRKDDLRRALAAAGLEVPPVIHSLEVISRTPSGRAARLQITGSARVTLRATPLRRAVGQSLGWELVRSDLYDVRDAGDHFVFHGYGSGHGVGLCQAGAVAMGNAGKSYAEILSYYYPGTALGLTAQGMSWHALAGERLDMLTTRAAEDRALIPLAERLMGEAMAQTGWEFPARPQLKVYPSVAVFRNATGEPGWVAASTRGRVVRLQPPETLREAGALESTLRHELLHLLLESRAKPGVPLWLREGVVLALAKPGGAAVHPVALRDSAALDRALNHPRSRQELQHAYEAARSRVAGLIAKYGKSTVLGWVERGLPPEIH